MLDVKQNTTDEVPSGDLLRDDPTYIAATELVEEIFPWNIYPPKRIDNPLKRVISREVGKLMRTVQELTDAKVSAAKSFNRADTELQIAREELAAAVAAWPKD